MTRQKWLLLSAYILAVAQTLWFAFGAAVEWSICCGWLIYWPFPVALSFVAVINGLGVLVALIWRSRAGLAILAGVEAGNIFFSIAAATTVSSLWLLDASLSLAIVVLVLVLLRWRTRSRAARL